MADLSEFLMIRNRTKEGTAAIQVWRKTSRPDLTEYVFLRKGKDNIDKYCHKDDYKVYKMLFDKVDGKND